MKPLRHPLVAGPGQRTPRTLLMLDERDALLVEAARQFPGLSHREIARRLRLALVTYANGRWQRSRADVECPHAADKLTSVLWRLLRARDAIPSERLIRMVLSKAGTDREFA
jgi:hypothetical protein